MRREQPPELLAWYEWMAKMLLAVSVLVIGIVVLLVVVIVRKIRRTSALRSPAET